MNPFRRQKPRTTFEDRARQNLTNLLATHRTAFENEGVHPAITLSVKFERDAAGGLTSTLCPGFSITVGTGLPKDYARTLLADALEALDRGDYDQSLNCQAGEGQ